MSGVTIRKQTVCSVVVAGCLFTAISNGQESTYITVTGTGEATAEPSIVELLGTVGAEDDLAGDAAAKFGSVKDDAIAALKALEIPGLMIVAEELAIGSVITQQSSLSRVRGDAPPPPKVSVKEALRIRLEGIDELDQQALLVLLTKVVDTAKESGVEFGPQSQDIISFSRISREGAPTYTTYKVAKPDELVARAYELAMEDAHARAARLAKLAGGKLGAVHSVSEHTFASIRQPQATATSHVYRKIKQSASLSVAYEWIRADQTSP